MRTALFATALAGLASTTLAAPAKPEPFLTQVDNQTWIIGNDVWNMTQGLKYGVKLNYKNRDLVGNAVGHYVSYNGAANDIAWTSASIVKRCSYKGTPYIDVKFTSIDGDFHWVIFQGLAGAYQYFVNHNLPTLGEFRTLWRLDNTTFPKGKTDLHDKELPPLSDYLPQNKVQDETWLTPDGKGYITKYDFSDHIRTQKYYGVYGDEVGSWYINAGKDYYNGNHLKQELMVHRESATGDAVQLNMIHGTHFQVSAVDVFPDGKMWGPWLWYLNDGSKEDAEARADSEFAAWPYRWLSDPDYQSRGTVKGKLVLSDGRPAAGAAVFLGDNHPSKTALDMGSDYYYTTYADASGAFEIPNVRTAEAGYALQAWSAGGKLADVTTQILHNDVSITADKTTDLGTLNWAVSTRKRLFQVGDFDRTSRGFAHGGNPDFGHAIIASCPADITFVVGKSQTSDWCYGQTYKGNYTIRFTIDEVPSPAPETANLIVSLGGYSTGASSVVLANGQQVGNLTSGAVGVDSTSGLLNDPSVYRSATSHGEWRFFEFPVPGALLKKGDNEVTFQLTRNTTWRGFIWDSIVLEW
ncbi:rhamnogalacturonate lyase [Colletotrichum truncatum]|uniref:Rhamnogalacturonate lyase n=1 Tax=Colletotrichum truncatum TaxID=5467 RepID=A0ACC3Z015_COLTU|nr:rhamnogalacturonate lyase [Colletotrichum truncatum]KAF6800801.1 rhamnogalacturonate lyase [Colletotrichum truncatum]